MIEKLEAALALRAEQGLTRTRRIAQGKTGPQVTLSTCGAVSTNFLQFGSNDYLGLASDARIAAAAARGMEKWGVGAGASHLVTGHGQAHQDLEEEIAAFLSAHHAPEQSSLSAGERGREEGVTVANRAGIPENLLNCAPSLVPGAQFFPAGFRGQANTQLLAFAKEMRTNQTDAESKLWGVLRAGRWRGLKFRRQHPVQTESGRYILDFYCHERSLCIELDGGQHAEDRSADLHRDAALLNRGIQTLRFWNHDVFNEWDGVLGAIWNATEPQRERSALSPNPSPRGRGGLNLDPLSLGERGRGEGATLARQNAFFQTSHSTQASINSCEVPRSPALRALTFSSGYLANLAVVTALCDRESIVFADKLNHACLNDGALLSRAQFIRFAHNDVAALRTRMENTCGAVSGQNATKLIAVDGVFSMDGDIAPLDEYLDLAEEFDAWLLVDDAHAFGVLGEGRGTAEHFGLQSERIITMGTLGKAAGVAGAFVAAHQSVIEWIINTARPYIYTTAQPPMLAEAAREAVRIIAHGENVRAQLQSNIAQFRAGCEGLPWTLLPSETAIQPLIVGSNDEALALARALEEKGIYVPAIRPPTVPQGSARLRVSLSAAHTAPQVQQLIEALHDIVDEQKSPLPRGEGQGRGCALASNTDE